MKLKMEIILRKSFVSMVLYGMLFSFLLTCTAIAQTEIEGEVSGEWNAEGSPYIIVGDANVPEDEELTLLPGTEMIFRPEVEFTVHGLFIAEGEEEDSVKISRPGVFMRPVCFYMVESSDECSFSYCRMDSLSLHVERCSIIFNNNLFYDTNIRLRDTSSDFYENECFLNQGERFIFSSNRCFDMEFTGNLINAEIAITEFRSITFDNNSGETFEINFSRGDELSFDNSEINNLDISGSANISVINCDITRRLRLNRNDNILIRNSNLIDIHCDIDYARNLQIDSINSDSTFFSLSSAIGGSITECQIWVLSMSRWIVDFEIDNNQIGGLGISNYEDPLDEVSLNITNNTIVNLNCHSYGVLTENNLINHINLRQSSDRSSIFRNNRIYSGIEISRGATPYFHRNDIGPGAGRIIYIHDVNREGTSPLFINNTIHQQGNNRNQYPIVEIDFFASGTFINNLFLGDGNGSQGILIGNEDGDIRECEIIEDHNAFWNLDPVSINFEIGENSIVANPLVMNRYVRDVHLAPNSPLIDTGLGSWRWESRDPDETTLDIGCYFFDQGENHPPFIYGDFELDADPFSEFSYEATVLDEEDESEVSFEDLPEWLEREFVEDHPEIIRLSGRPPENDEDEYLFSILAEDAEGQSDSLGITITMSPYSLLSGDTFGQLTHANSPYIAISQLVVPEGENLEIEPGVELRFRLNEDAFANSHLMVNGTLTAIGTEEDLIVFIPEEVLEYPDARFQTWQGIVFDHSSEDSSIMEYCHVKHAQNGIFLNEAEKVRISHSKIDSCFKGVYSKDSSVAIISENLIFRNYYRGIEAEFSDLIITGNQIIGFGRRDTLYMTFGLTLSGDSYLISNNIIRDISRTAIDLDFSNSFISNNIFISNWIGLRPSNQSVPKFYNNTIINQDIAILINPSRMNDSGADVKNNIFAFCDPVAILEDTDTVAVDLPELDLTHNLFYENSEDFRDIPRDPAFGELADVNANGDSCDAYFNIFIDPRFENFEEGIFELTEDSPCIDAGTDVGLSFACDAPDIGAFEFGRNVIEKWKDFIPRQFEITFCYPNPFNSTVSIGYYLDRERNVSLSIFDLSGREVESLYEGITIAGNHCVIWQAEGMPSGVYFARLKSHEKVLIQKLHLLR